MKKFLNRVVSIFIAMLFALSLAGCSQSSHVHNYTWFLVASPTAEQDGLLEGICSCGKKELQDLTSGGSQPHKHSYQWSLLTEPTVQIKGQLEGVCSCGDKNVQEIPKLEIDGTLVHSYDCTLISEPSAEEGVCSCGATIHAHNYEWEVKVPPTTENKGLIEGVCSCGHINRQEIPKLDTQMTHTHSYEWKLKVAPTKEEKGLIEGICSCGHVSQQELSKLETNGAEHSHNYQWWYFVTNPTCEEEGLMQGLCGCGAKTEIVLAKKGHKIVNGCCENCDYKVDAIYLEENQELGYTVDGMVNLAKDYKISDSDQEIKNSLSNVSLRNLYVNFLGQIKSEVKWQSNYYEVNLLDIRSDYVIDATSDYTVLEIDIVNGSLQVIMTDGTVSYMGNVTGLAQATFGRTIDSIVINKQNQLLLVYSNREVVLVGNIPTKLTETDSSTLIYRLDVDHYSVVGAFDYSVKEIVIPATHRGIPVEEIARKAFYDCVNLEKIVIPTSVEKIGSFNFEKCTNLSLVNYEGSESDWAEITIMEYGNDYLQSANKVFNYNV